MRLLYILPAALIGLCACGEPTARPEEVPQAVNPPPETPLPATDLGNTYPSQTGESVPVTPGAEGGRSSAATGETPPAPASDPNAQQQQQATPP